MIRKYKSENEVYELLRSFEDATVAPDDWKHAEHLVVALCYLEHYDLETAIEKMRSGLFNLLVNGFGVDLTEKMPYHETLTVFWMRTVYGYKLMTNGAPILEKANDLVAKFDKDYPLKFYTRGLLFSDEARARFVEGDLQLTK
jgi:hypothetical protein